MAPTVKFSNPDDTIQRLQHFIMWVASHNEDPDNIMMSYDDLVGELSLELVKGIQRYGHLPMDERLALIRKMIDNRLGELRYRYYLTHRKATKLHISIDMEYGEEDDTATIEDCIPSNEGVPEDLLDSKSRVEETRNKLGEQARKVFDALIYGDERVTITVLLSVTRAGNIFKSPTAKISAWHIADALFMDTKEVNAAIREIKVAYSEVLNGRE